MYKIYFYSDPIFLYIDSENILDLDLKIIEGKKEFEMKYNDVYFTKNMKDSRSKSWVVFIQSFDEKNKFLVQSNLSGDNLVHRKIKNGYCLRLQYDQITNNKIWASLPPTFETGEIEYKKNRLSYYRNIKLLNILD